MELNSVMIYHLGEELRGRKGQTSVEMGVEVDPLAVARVGDGFFEAALPVTGGKKSLLLHVPEALLVESAGDPETAKSLFLR